MPTPYDAKDAAEDTEVEVKEVKEAWHQAKNDAQDDGEKLSKRKRSEK